MTEPQAPTTTETERGVLVALIFALVAERLRVHYEHGQWLTQAQCSTLAADWLARSKRKLLLALRQHLAGLSDQLARQLAESTSREAGLHVSHELQEALDPRYQSELGQSVMAECARMLDENPQPFDRLRANG
ncbi:hypothetical protein GALL_310890 [mine drainage metagenome]|uniref:Uncharacterized protein n=1 Tax=mine drainage metagenome TaxID=410659 RepID=A0A1J5QUB7_9ZZZZ